mmetsp:Transcript_14565/g.41617  ORF Transcript_14565/g.41617 Transcript_14565/m.41617 type:complete len:225 (+) Transcript_14565:583-1257(+)
MVLCLSQEFTIVQFFGVLHQRREVIQNHRLLHLDIDCLWRFIPALLKDHRAMFDQQGNVHELQCLHMHECTAQKHAQRFLELEAFLLQLGLVQLVGLKGFSQCRLHRCFIILPGLEVVHHPQTQVDFCFLDQDSDGVFVLFLVPQRALGILVSTLRVAHLRVHGHPAFEVHQSHELFERVHERNPLNGQDGVQMDVPHTFAARLRTYFQGALGLDFVMRVLRPR